MKKIYLLFLSVLVLVTAQAQVVTVTNPGNTTPGLAATYGSLAAAITAVNATTAISGPVTITLNAGNPQTAPVGGYSITAIPVGASAANNITFEGSGNTITAFTPQVAGSLTDAVIKLIGSDFITIQNFTLQENAGNTNFLTSTTYLTNTGTEFGIALFYASATDGAQNNTIQNNTISLNRLYANTFGIYSNTRHTATVPGTAAEITALTGANSFNKVYGNAISNVNYGIVFIGSGAATAVGAMDNGTDIGGASAATGNTITGWGGVGIAPFATYVGLTANDYCIFVNNTYNDNISFNTITSFPNGMSAATATMSIGGILKNYSTVVTAQPTGTIATTINNNTVSITITPIAAGSTIVGINNQGLSPLLATATVNMNNNTVQNCNINGALATTSGITGITNLSIPGVLNMNANNVLNNTTTTTAGVLTGAIVGISNSGAATTASISNNSIIGSVITTPTATTPILNGITNSAAVTTLNINSNIFRNFASSSTLGQMQGINNTATGLIVTTLNINNNQLGNAAGGFYTGTAANAGTLFGIISSGAAATCATSVSGNDIRGITYNVASSSINAYITTATLTFTPLSNNISNNTFTNLNVNTTGAVTFINHSYTIPLGVGSSILNNNSIVTGFTRTGATGSVVLTTTGLSSGTGTVNNYTNNNFSNITVSGTTTIVGFNNTDGGTGSTKTITGNTFSNWTAATGNITGMIFNYWNGTSSLSTNTITNITGQANITGISMGATSNVATLITVGSNTITGLSSTGTGGNVTGLVCSNTSAAININNNTINTLSSTGASAVTGINITNSLATKVFKNVICNLSGSNASSTVSGIQVSAVLLTSVTTLHNNRIADLRTPSANAANPLIGINITNAAANIVNSYYNTVYLNGASTGALFGSSAISVSTTPIVTLNNNIFVNASSVMGAGVAVAHRRSTATLTSYAAGSDKNDFFASTIYTDGITPQVTLGAYKTLLATRDVASVTENPTFLSTACGNANFLKIDGSVSTLLESSAVNIAGITDDFENEIRQGNAGYLSTGTAPDMGADEFTGSSPAPSLTFVSAAPTTTAQCIKAPRVITVTATSPSGTTISGIVINYSHGGTAQTPITMTFVSGTTWQGTMLAPTTGNATVTWNVVATNNVLVTATYTGTTYSDEPLLGVTVTATPSPNPVCAGPNLGLTSTVSGGGTYTYAWTSTPVGFTSAVQNPTAVTPTNGIIYNVVATNTLNSCTVAGSTAAVTVNPLPTAPTATNSTQCGAGVPTASVADLNGFVTPTFKWYAALTGGAALQSSTSTTYTTSISTVGINTFYVSVTNPATSCESARTPITITVNTPPVLTLTGPQTICNNQPYPIAVTSTLTDYNTYKWTPITNLYTDAAGTIPYLLNASATTVYVKSNTAGPVTYTCTANNTTSFCTITATSTVTVQPAVSSITAPITSYCGVGGIPTITANPASGYAAGTLQWQSSTTGLPLSYTDIGGATAAAYTAAAALTQTTYYQLLVKDGVGTSCAGTQQITITVNNPSIAGTTAATRCGTGSVTLGATASGATLNWYAASSGGTPLQSSAATTFTTPIISATTNYYVSASAGAVVNANIGTGALTSAVGGISPYYHGWGGVKSQFIILKSELNAAGIIGAGNISSVAFEITTLGTTPFQTFTINLANTLQTVTTTTNIPVGAANYSIASQPLTLGVNTYSFTTPFTWDGTSNIVVQTCYSNVNTGATSSAVKYDNPGFTSTTYTYADNQTAAAIYATTTGSTGGSGGSLTATGRPKMTLIQAPCEGARSLVIASVTAPPPFSITNATSATLPYAACNGGITRFDATYTALDYNNVTWTVTGGNLYTSYTNAGTNTPYIAGTSAPTVYLVSTTAGTATVTANASHTLSFCANVATISVNILPAITVSAAPTAICISGFTTLSIAPAAASYTGATIQWQNTGGNIGGATGLTYTTPILNANESYNVVLTSTTGACTTPTPLVIVVNNPTVVTTTDATICGTGTAILNATASAGATLNWYAAASGGASLGTGTSFTTPTINTTTQYYVSATNASSAITTSGLGNTSIPTTTLVSAERGIVFTPSVNGKVVSAQYYTPSTATVTNTVTVRLLNNTTGAVLNNLTLPIAQTGAGWYTMNLNLSVTAGITYRLLASFTSSINRISAGADYSSSTFNNLAPLGTITSGYDGAVSTTSYNYFHNIVVETPCESGRTLVTAYVTAPPAITPPAAVAYCAGGSASLTVTSGNPNYTYAWSPATGLSATTGATVTASPTGTTTYTITATDITSTPACVAIGTVTVTVNPLPTGVTATASSTNVCGVTTSIDLTSTVSNNPILLSEGFETVPTGWTVATGSVNNWVQTNTPTGSANTGTGVAQYSWNNTLAADAWLFTPPQNLTAGVTYTISSWYRGSGTTFPEKMKVTVGTANTIAAQNAGTIISDIGTGPIPPITSTTYAQQLGTFTPTTSGVYYFAWNAYSAANMFYIDLDDILITQPPATYNFDWTSTPAGFGSSVQNPTGVIPNNGDVFNVTVTNAATGCFAAASTAPVVVNPIPAIPLDASIANQCGAVTFNVTSVLATPIFHWFDAATGGTLLATTATGSYSPAVTITPGANLVWVSVTNGFCESPRVALSDTSSASPGVHAITGGSGATQVACNNAYTLVSVTAATLANFPTHTWSSSVPGTLFQNTSGLAYTGQDLPTVYVKSSTVGNITVVGSATNGTCSASDNTIIYIQPGTVTLSATTTAICQSGSTTISANPATGYAPGTLQWQSSSAFAGPYSDIVGATGVTYTTPVISATTYYQLVVKNSLGAACLTPKITLTVNNPSIATNTPGTRCGAGTVLLGATSTGGATNINWYAAASGGTPLQSSAATTFTTPSISTNTTYYVSGSVGTPVTAIIGAGASTATSYDNPFYSLYSNSQDQILIKASELTAAGLIGGRSITSLSYTINSGFTIMPDFSLSIAPYANSNTALTGFLTSGFTQVYSNATGVTNTPGVNTITFGSGFVWDGTSHIVLKFCWGNIGSSATMSSTIVSDPVSYVCTYNAHPAAATAGAIVCASTTLYSSYSARPKFTLVQGACESARTPVLATVTAPPALAIDKATDLICTGSSSTVTVTPLTVGNFNTYTWSGGVFTASGVPIGSVGNLSPTVSPTTYTLTAIRTSDGCTNTANVVVSMTPTPSAFTVTPAAPTAVCVGSAAQLLTANGGVSTAPAQYNFGTGITQNTATTLAGGYPAPYSLYYGGQRMQMLVTAAELNAAGFVANSKITSVQFPVASLGANWGSTVTALNNYQVSIGATALTSLATFQTGLTQVVAPANFTPVVGYTNTHTFSSAFVWDGTSNVILETTFSNNLTGGAADLVAQYNTATIYQSTIVYRADGVTAATAAAATTVSYSYSARPDFKLNGTTNLNPSIVWAPTAGLYTDAAATIAYTGTATATVYAKPLLTQLYTATATVGACTRTATSNVLITPQPNATIAYTGTPYCASGTAAVTVSGTAGTTGGTYSSTAGLVINTASGLVNLAISTAGTYTVTYTVAAAGGCSLYTTTTIIKINANGSWGGTVSSDWNNAANWQCGGIPTSASNVTIPSGTPNNPIINATGAGSANNITVAAGATLTVSGVGILNLYGALTSTGNVIATDGTINVAGAVAQTLAGTSFATGTIKNIKLSNSASLSSALAVTGNVSYGASNVVFTTNNNLTLISNLGGTAALNDITNNGVNSGNTITGNVSIQRYLFAKRAWRYLAAPVQTAGSPSIFNSWQEGGPFTVALGTQITGPASYVGIDQTTLAGSMKYYDMPNDAFIFVNNTSVPIANKEGYFVFVRGDRTVAVGGAAVPTTLRIKGQVITGNQNYTVNAGKYLSIGNPYPSRIAFIGIWNNTIADAFTVWNPLGIGGNNLGIYETYVKNAGVYSLNGLGVKIRNYIESGEGFFVQNNSATLASITIKEIDKANGSANVSRVGVTKPTLEISLFTNDATGTNYVADGSIINFESTYSNNIDNNDVRKVFNIADNLAISSNGKMLVAERRQIPVVTDSIFLNLSGTREANYHFELDPSVLNFNGLEAFMKDKFLGTETPVSLTNVTNIPFAITADAASKAADRFVIVFKQGSSVNFTTISALRNADKTVSVNWGTQNEVGVINYAVEHSNDGINFTQLNTQLPIANNGSNPAYTKQDVAATKANNWYRVKVNVAGGAVKYTATAMVGALQEPNLAPSISIYPNPILDRMVHVKFVNKVGTYTLQLVATNGKTIQTQQVTVTNNEELKTMLVGKHVAAGNYDILISSATGTEHIKVVILN